MLQQTLSQPSRIITQPKTRLTLVQATQAILDNSWLKACSEGDINSWPEAATHDIEEVNKLARAFVRDMNKFLKSRYRRIQLKEEFSLALDVTTTEENRCQKLWEMFKITAKNYLDNLAKNIIAKPQYINSEDRAVDMPFPMCWIIKEGDCVSFKWADSPDQVTNRTMVRAAYVDPYDFPRYMPPIVKEMLEIAKTTNLEYNPAVLDGVLIEEKDVPLLRPKDPALVLRCGHDIMVHYWKEPTNDKDKRILARNPWHIGRDWAGVFGAAIFMLFFLSLGIGVIQTLTGTLLGILVPVFVVLAGFGLIATGLCLYTALSQRHRTLKI